MFSQTNHKNITQPPKGADNAFRKVFEEYYYGLYQYALSYLKDEDEAKNAVQDVFVLLLEKKETLDDNTNIKAYLVASLKYILWNEINKKRRRLLIQQEMYRETIGELDLNLYTLDHTPIATLCADELKDIIRNTLDEQGKLTKEIFMLSRENNLSYKEIAKKLELSTKSIEYHMSKTLAALRVALKPYLTLIGFFFYIFSK